MKRVLFAFVAVAAAATAADTVTYADVRAFFEAGQTGGLSARIHSGVGTIPPLAGGKINRANIRPFPIFDGRHYCADDWHAILITNYALIDPPFVNSLQDAQAELRNTTVQMDLDGEPLDVSSTAVKRVDPDVAVNFFGGTNPMFFRNFGRLMAPAELGVGAYQLHVALQDPVYDPIFGTFDTTITFYVDPSGSAACQ